MPFVSSNAFDPTDPVQWARIRALPHIVVRPNPVPDASPPDDGIDDWFAPWQASDGPNNWIAPGSLRSDTSYPYDWFAPPPSVAPNAGRLPSGAPPNVANSGTPYPAVPPDPVAAYWSSIPASRVGAMAWDPPNLPLFPPSSTNNFPASTSPSPQPILPGSWPRTLGLDSPPWSSPQWWPNPAIPKGGLLDGLATLGTGWPAGGGGLLGGLANLGTQSASLPNLPKGGILDALATLGTPAPASPTSSLGGSFPGSAGPARPPMPSALDAFFQGLGSGSRQVAQSIQSMSGPPSIAAQDSPAAEPLGWSDLASPSRIAPKVAYQFAQSYPTLAGGVAGGIAGGRVGALVGPYGAAAGTLIGGSLGAAALSAAQTLGPSYVAELQKTPNDPEGAWDRAWKQAEISGAFSGASWAVFPARFFQNPVKQLVFQIFGAQPALAVGERATRNIVDGRPVSEGLGEAYGQGVVGTAIPALGHGVVGPFLPERVPARRQELDRSTLDNATDGSPPAEKLRAKRAAQLKVNSAAGKAWDADGLKGRGVWDLPGTKRGRTLEQIFGHNLHPNHPTIDVWDPDTGATTSLKSIDLEAPVYEVNGKYGNALYSKLSKAVDKLADFEGGRYAGNYVPKDEITSRTLTVIVPSLGTAEQREVLRRISGVGNQRGVMVRVEVYR